MNNTHSMKFCFRLIYKPYKVFEQILSEINTLFELSNHKAKWTYYKENNVIETFSYRQYMQIKSHSYHSNQFNRCRKLAAKSSAYVQKWLQMDCYVCPREMNSKPEVPWMIMTFEIWWASEKLEQHSAMMHECYSCALLIANYHSYEVYNHMNFIGMSPHNSTIIKIRVYQCIIHL